MKIECVGAHRYMRYSTHNTKTHKYGNTHKIQIHSHKQTHTHTHTHTHTYTYTNIHTPGNSCTTAAAVGCSSSWEVVGPVRASKGSADAPLLPRLSFLSFFLYLRFLDISINSRNLVENDDDDDGGGGGGGGSGGGGVVVVLVLVFAVCGVR